MANLLLSLLLSRIALAVLLTINKNSVHVLSDVFPGVLLHVWNM
jgi:hypothetical protein